MATPLLPLPFVLSDLLHYKSVNRDR